LTASTQKLPAAARAAAPRPPTVFAAAIHTWLARAGRNQQGLAQALGVNPSTVTGWVKGHKRPDELSVVRTLATLRGWLGPAWRVVDALDTIAGLDWDWAQVRAAAERRLQKGGTPKSSCGGGIPSSPQRAAPTRRPGLCAMSRARSKRIWAPR